MSGRGARVRLLILGLVLAAGGGAISARLVDLQVRQHPRFVKLARANRNHLEPLPARRGDIHDRRGRELALSVPSEKIAVRPRDVTDPAGSARILADILGRPARELERALGSGRRYFYLEEKPTPRQVRRIRAEQEAGRLAGIVFEEWHRRIYPHRSLAAHAIGWVRNDGTGGGGLEYRFDEPLRGAPGRVLQVQDAHDDTFQQEVLEAARPGDDLELTLDLTVQHVLQEELERAARRHGAASGAAVAMDPRSGEVLALASWPTFNPNDYASASSAQLQDRSVVSAYEPGSTFKIVTAAAALEHGRVRPNEVFYCGHGRIRLPIGRTIRDHKKFGDLTFTRVMAESSNVGAIKAGLRLKPEEFYDVIRRFGFGERSGVGLSGESPGLLKAPRDWSGLTHATLAIGQEIAVTPLQMLAALSAVAADGVYRGPWLVRALRDADSGRLTPMTPPEPRRVISRETAHALTRMLIETVEDGTGKAAGVPGYAVAGKTGTAQISRPTGGYIPGAYVASFAGYAPAWNPRLAAIFVLDRPRTAGNRYHGGDVAAPAFGRFAARVLPALGAEPDRPAGQGGLEQVVLRRPRQDEGHAARWVTLSSSRPPAPALTAPALPPAIRAEPGIMPDLTGRTLREAVALLTGLGVSPVLEGQGRVVLSDPPAGAPLAPDQGCRLWLGSR